MFFSFSYLFSCSYSTNLKSYCRTCNVCSDTSNLQNIEIYPSITEAKTSKCSVQFKAKDIGSFWFISSMK